MGLAAGQARLLSITSRKSDCEFQSMRLSHQKIALSRELADLSNEYQNSLDQTKLVYDYYGTGDTNTPLTYDILMTPSTLNDYMPITLTDTSGRVTLNSKYAAAARAAGIPQEGLGTLPSETMRNAFVNGLAQAGIITDKTASTILGLPYNQAAGFGGGTTVALITDTGNINELSKYLNENGTAFTLNSTAYTKHVDSVKNGNDTVQIDFTVGTTTVGPDCNQQITLGNLLTDQEQYYLDYSAINGEQSPVIGLALMQQYLTDEGGFIDWLYDEFSAILDLGDGYTGAALAYAYEKITELIMPDEGKAIEWGDNYSGGGDMDERTSWKDNQDVRDYINSVGVEKEGTHEDYNHDIVLESKDYIGFRTGSSSQKGWHDDGEDCGTAGINLNNIAKAFITYFADYMNGVDKTDANGQDKYYVNKGAISTGTKLVTEDSLYMYTWATGSTVSSDDTGQAVFFDTLFNQLCANGWTENNKIEDKEYLQQMLQSGMLYISKVKEDGYYYQANYATDSYIKEIADETYIAQAEAKYNTEKQKLNAKEETLDLKMKNLDTEISSLTTEYDTVKNTISKNIEKSFKRYNA